MITNLIKSLPGSNEECIKEKASKLLSENNSCSNLTSAITNAELLIGSGEVLIKNMFDTVDDVLNYLEHCSDKPYYKRYTCYMKQLDYILKQVKYYDDQISTLIDNAESVVSEIIGDLEDCLFHKAQILYSQIKTIKQSCEDKL